MLSGVREDMLFYIQIPGFFWLSDREILNRGKFSMSGNKGVCVHKALVKGCDNVSQIKLVFIYIILF